MEHELDRPAEPEEEALHQGDRQAAPSEQAHPADAQLQPNIEQSNIEPEDSQPQEPREQAKQTREPVKEPVDPDLLPLPPAPLPRDVQADRERAELAHELTERRFLRRRQHKASSPEKDAKAKDTDPAEVGGNGEEGPASEHVPALKPTPLPGGLVTPVSPEEEAEMNALIEALFKEQSAAKGAGSAHGEAPGGLPAVEGDAPGTTEVPEGEAEPETREDEAPEEAAGQAPRQTPPGKRFAKRDEPLVQREPKTEKPENNKIEAEQISKEAKEAGDFLHQLRQQWSLPEEGTPEEDLTQTGKLRVRAIWSRLMEQTDEYAKTMYEEETETEDPSPDWAESLLKRQMYDQEARFQPDVPEEEPENWEEEECDKEKKRRLPKFLRRFHMHEEPDDGAPEFEYTPGEMANIYKKLLGRQRMRALLVGLAALLLCYVALAQRYLWPFPGGGAEGTMGYIGVSLGLTCVAALLGWEVIRDGITGLFRVKANAELLAAVSVLASILDAGALILFQTRTVSMPFCAVSVCSLLFALWGRYSKGRSRRMSYRVASLSDPYLVTKDSEKWEGGKCFTKHLGSIRGFVSQVEAPDGVERVYQHLAPLLLLASLLFGLLVSIGKSEPGLFLWSFSAMTAASASFSSFFAYSMPYAKLTRRLMNSGATLAGWPGVSAAGGRKGIALGDRELFPAGAVEISGLSVFGSHTEDTVIAYVASVMRESGCGLDKTFHELLRRRGMILRRVEELNQYESGGFSAVIRGQSILIGSAGFMREAKVRIAPGQHVKHAVFCAIDGELAGIFALKYRGGSGVKHSLSRLLRSRLSPVVVTRDFNVTPEMLSQRFKIKADDLAYPPLEERLALSDPKQDYELPLVGLLVRDGLAPFAETVVGARRLCRAVVFGGVFAIFNSVIGVLMAFYLTYVKAFDSISALHLLVFMLMWLVPAVLVARGVNRY